MADPDRAIRSVVVLGSGIVALSAALAFRHALPGIAVTVVETPSDPAALADRMTTAWPSIARFHDSIGLTERSVIAAGAGTPLLGTRFIDPASERPPAFVVHGQYGVPIGSIPFHQLWARGWRAGTALPYSAHATAAVLAAAGKFVHPEDDPRSPLSTYDYGLRIDPLRYRALLAARADAVGIIRSAGVFAGITRRADGRVATLALADGRQIAADLFIDGAGPDAPVLSQLGVQLTAWTTSLPDAVTLARGPATTLGSCDTITATPAGWAWAVGLGDRELRGLAFHADSGLDIGSRLTGADREVVQLRPGWRDPWCENVLAIGDAAMSAAPVPGFHLHLVHLAIARALDLLPGRDCAAREVGEYRRRASLQAERLGDFLCLFQSSLQPDTLTEGLADTIDHFVRRGRFVPGDEDAFGKDMWIAALIGRGFVPQENALAEAVDSEQANALLEDLSRGLASVPGQLPDYPSYLQNWSRQSEDRRR
ncbi:tryptophan 7-halogenase [Sphingomonas sp. RT2P30]|uniref:tryptophan 7-halogenase n=1 Tax=Parasphingomonas halimpatiens TaxID=3096162 RepID=UPI002FC5C97E